MKVFKIALKIAGIIILLVILMMTSYCSYMSSRVNALPEARKFTDLLGEKTASKNILLKDTRGNYIVQPGKNKNDTGLIIYPASFADEKAYIPVAFKFADEGYTVFIAKMPFRLSVLYTENGLNFLSAYTNIKKWFIAGHSLGGIAASIFVQKKQDKISGIIFWASKPAMDMKNSIIKVLLVFSSKDGFFKQKSFDEAKIMLPAGAEYYTVKGGNHSQFAWYPDMPGDLKAEITREEQQRQVISVTINFMKKVSAAAR